MTRKFKKKRKATAQIKIIPGNRKKKNENQKFGFVNDSIVQIGFLLRKPRKKKLDKIFMILKKRTHL